MAAATRFDKTIKRNPSQLHREHHLVSRIGWRRAAVLGANDGIVPTASMIVGSASSSATNSELLIAGVAEMVAAAMSMAAGEYVSVSSQSDTEQADLARERQGLASPNTTLISNGDERKPWSIRTLIA